MLVNARSGTGIRGSVRIAGSHIVDMGKEPHADDKVIDLRGDRLLPGLINAHDHLQLNNLPELDRSKQYSHVQEWIADINARRRTDPAFEAHVAAARDERLLIGGMKNLLSGVTTVAHHDPLYPFLTGTDCPVRVVTKCGWSHSLYLDGEDGVRAAYRRTPLEWPWIIHAAEGKDEHAAAEFERLDALGCIGPNTLLVHGIALDEARRERLMAASAGLIWCPSSNLRLFGRTADIHTLSKHRRVALGTDSRLSGARDLLDELRIVGELGGLDEHSMEALVTSNAASLLRLSDRGSLEVGSRADILVLPAEKPLSHVSRADVRLVMLNGVARYGDADYVERLLPASHRVSVRVDGAPKVLERRIGALLARSRVHEVGLDVPDLGTQAA
ncbi:MAG: amidohydrolase [Gammaproteobacteria bacterium]|nr:amidohydrolase [Gammaproteobacteria bacterium]